MIRDIDGFGPDDIADRFGVSRETLDRIETVLACLDTWRGRMNLIGPAQWDHIWRRHVADSLRIWPLIPADAMLVDLGSGGGFPALPLACALTAEGRGHVTLVETTGKKVQYLRAAILAAGLRAEARQGRAESVKDIDADYVTARALAPLPKLLDYSHFWLANGATGLFHKGENWKDELTAAANQWTFRHEAIQDLDGGTGIILKVSEVSRERTQDQSAGRR